MFNVGSAVATLKADISNFKDGMNEAKSQANSLGDTMTKIGDGIADFGKKSAIFTGVVAAGLAVVGKVGLDSAAKFEQYQIAFTTLLKDEKKAMEAIKNIQQDAAKTPFELAPLVMANQRLISAGISAEKARKDILNLGDAISATGGGGAELERLSTNLQQIKAVGKASALDIKQFAFAGINVYQLLAEATGKNVEEVKNMDVSYELLSKAFEKASGKGGMFENAMIKQSKSLNGLISTLKDTVSLGLKDILMNSGLFEIIRQNVEKLIPLLESLVPKIVAFFTALPKDPVFVAVLTTLTTAFSAFSEWVSKNQELVIFFLQGFAIAIGALLVIGTVTAMITALTMFVIAVTALYMAWQTNFWGIRDITSSVFNELKIIWENILLPTIEAIVASVTAAWQNISAVTTVVWPVIWGTIQVIWALIYGLISVGLALMTGDWKQAWENILHASQIGWEGLKDIFWGVIGMVKTWGGELLHWMVQPFIDAWNQIQDLVRKIKDAMDPNKRHSPSLVDRVKTGVQDLNKAWEGLSVPMPTYTHAPEMNFAGATMSGGTGPISITIPMAGAFIGDEMSAQRMSEVIGNNIIKKLQANIRF